MKYAKKMILVDYNTEMERKGGIGSRNAEADGHEKYVSHLDNLIHEILTNSDLSEYEKIKLYNEVLQKYLFARKAKIDRDKEHEESLLNELTGVISKKIEKPLKEDAEKIASTSKSVAKLGESTTPNEEKYPLSQLLSKDIVDSKDRLNLSAILKEDPLAFTPRDLKGETKFNPFTYSGVKLKMKEKDLGEEDEVIYDPKANKTFLKRKLEFYDFSPEPDSDEDSFGARERKSETKIVKWAHLPKK